nr:replication initiation protein [Microvirus sp.]
MKDAIFVTLTYNDAHLPRNSSGTPTLDKRDYQLFFKRLRKQCSGKKIRYVLSGEYGSRTYRPHYHAIIFGLSLRDFPDIRQQSTNELGHPFFTSPTLERIWSNGYILMSGVTFHTCNYVARYTLKKQFGRKDEYEDGRKPEFMVTSRRPGIGKDAAVRRLATGNTRFSVDGKDGVFETSIPTSILKRIKETKEVDSIEEMCYNNARRSQESLKQELILSGITYEELLDRKSQKLARKLRMLPERR